MNKIVFDSEKKAPNLLVRFGEGTDRELRSIATIEDVTLAATVRTMVALGLEVYRKRTMAAEKQAEENLANIEKDVRDMDE